MIRIFVFIAILVSTINFNVFSQEYIVDAKKSKLEWLGEKISSKHYGTVDIKDGMLKKEVSNFSGIFNIDMTSIKNIDLKDPQYNNKLIGHLKSDDFFSVDKFQTATFKLKSIKETKSKKDAKITHTVTGDLTIKGITNEISFPAKIKFNTNNFTANAKFVINRSKWDIRFGSGSFFDNLGDKMIYDDIQFTLTLVANTK